MQSLSDNLSGISDVRIQRINVVGNVLFNQSGLTIESSDSSSYSPIICSSQSLNAVIFYHDQRGPSVRIQKIDTSGVKYWDEENVVVSYIDELPTDKNIISDMSGGVIVCWTEYPAILYAQQISANGNLEEVLSVERENFETIQSKITLYPAYPNPFNGGTVVSFILPSNIKDNLPQIGIYDLLGRQIFMFDNRTTHPGLNKLHWGGRNAFGIPVSSGTYFLKIEGSGGISAAPMIKVNLNFSSIRLIII